MSDRASGNWLPYDLNGSVHECKRETATGTKKVETNNNQPLTIEQIDARLQRLESILIESHK